MATWDQLKTGLMNQKTELDNRTTDTIVDQKVTAMNTAISRFVSRAGISQNPASDADYNTANALFNELSALEKNYITLNTNLSAAIRQMTSASDVQNKLQTVGTLRNDILNLERELKDVKQDANTSLARQDSVDKPAQSVSFYQGFGANLGFTKPLHKLSIPILIGFGVLMLFFSSLILREFFSPTVGSYGAMNGIGAEGVFSLFTDSRAISVLSGVVFVIIVITILSLQGYLGTTLK
jgi:hypothetical protein